ncbi:hypothetical protein ACFL27_20090 [candidate division CSSED10-310 bacterium]|uniref:Transcriptional regulator n=1 Tax=candidate division CSSED10-310 bacterium TaxID=2855610 RepID=A0ABV6Z218_UNCC1
MYLLTAVINNEELMDDLITGWLDLGITGATIAETTGSLQLISQHIPIFAGFRALTSGGGSHNKTIFTTIEDKEVLDLAIEFLKRICLETGKSNQGIYFVTPVSQMGRLGHDDEDTD